MRITAAIDAQPVAADPFARARDDGFVVRELAAQLAALRPAFRRGARATAGARWRPGRSPRRTTCRRRRRLRVFAGLQQRDASHRQRRQHVGDARRVRRRTGLRGSRRARFRPRVPSRRAPTAAPRARGCCARPVPASHSAVRESPRPSAAFCRASSDTTSARRRSRSARAASRRPSASNCAARSFCERSSATVSACDNSSAVLRASDSFSASCPSSAEDSCAMSASRSIARRSDCAGEAPQLVFELLDAGALHLRGLVRRALLAVEILPALLPAGAAPASAAPALR